MCTPRVIPLCLILSSFLPTIATAQDAIPASPGIVFTVHGSVELGGVAETLADALGSCGVPLQVQPFRWSHGSGRLLMDLRNQARHQAKGRELACHIQDYRHNHPGCKVYLLAFSAGAAVVLSAAEHLPPDSIERIILLAPACSKHRELRPLLTCSRQGVDVFFSNTDLISHALPLIGTTDGWCHSAAGAAGFEPAYRLGEDRAIFAKLRQHEDGFCGHFGCLRAPFLCHQIVPLLDCEVQPQVQHVIASGR